MYKWIRHICKGQCSSRIFNIHWIKLSSPNCIPRNLVCLHSSDTNSHVLWNTKIMIRSFSQWWHQQLFAYSSFLCDVHNKRVHLFWSELQSQAPHAYFFLLLQWKVDYMTPMGNFKSQWWYQPLTEIFIYLNQDDNKVTAMGSNRLRSRSPEST